MMKHLTEIAAASDLPVSADLGNGFGDAPEVVAETIRLAGAAGVVGGSIEDATGRADQPIYERNLAVERVKRRSGGRSQLAVSIYADGAGGKLPARKTGSERHHQAVAALSVCGSRCSLRSRPDKPRRYCRGYKIRGSTCECSHGAAGLHPQRDGIIGYRSSPREHRQWTVPRCIWRVPPCRARDAAARYVHLHR